MSRERHPFLVWWLFTIDTYALLSGTSKGEVVHAMMVNDLVPPWNVYIHPVGPDGLSVIHPEERESLPLAARVNYEICLLAARLGQLARLCRTEWNDHTSREGGMMPNIHLRIREVFDMQVAFRQLMASSEAARLDSLKDSLPDRSRNLYIQVWHTPPFP